MLCCGVCSLWPCGRLLGGGWPLVCVCVFVVVFAVICRFAGCVLVHIGNKGEVGAVKLV